MSLGELPESQRRSVFACLRVLEDRLDRLEEGLRKGGLRHGWAVWMDDVDPETHRALGAQVRDIRSILDAAFQALGHPPEVLSVFQQCQAALGMAWEDSLELRGKNMRNYGPLSESLAGELDVLAASLADRFLRLQHSLGEQKPS